MSAQKELEFSEQLNPNTEFLKGRGFWAFYVSLIVLTHFFIKITLSVAYPALYDHSITVTNFFHSIITLYTMHWVKGASFVAPFWSSVDGGKWDKLTWWEQLDNGQQNTLKKKILTAIPIVISTLACAEAGFESVWVLTNFVLVIIAILGKLPFMHRARILGINK